WGPLGPRHSGVNCRGSSSVGAARLNERLVEMFGPPTHPVDHLLLHDECGVVVQIGAADATAASWQRRTPSQLGAASRQRLNSECSTGFGGRLGEVPTALSV